MEFGEDLVNAALKVAGFSLRREEVKVFLLYLGNDFFLRLGTDSFGADSLLGDGLLIEEAIPEEIYHSGILDASLDHLLKTGLHVCCGKVLVLELFLPVLFRPQGQFRSHLFASLPHHVY
jgi:hypothetical protein